MAEKAQLSKLKGIRIHLSLKCKLNSIFLISDVRTSRPKNEKIVDVCGKKHELLF